MELDPETCKWRFLGSDDGSVPSEKKPTEKKDEFLCLLVDEFLKDDWNGTATDLSEALNKIDTSSGVTLYNIRTRLEATARFLEDEFNIILGSDREGGSGKKLIFLSRRSE